MTMMMKMTIYHVVDDDRVDNVFSLTGNMCCKELLGPGFCVYNGPKNIVKIIVFIILKIF